MRKSFENEIRHRKNPLRCTEPQLVQTRPLRAELGCRPGFHKAKPKRSSAGLRNRILLISDAGHRAILALIRGYQKIIILHFPSHRSG